MLVKPREALATLPVPVSEREFRLAARRLDKNHLLGRQMLVELEATPQILKEIERCRTKTNAQRRAKQKRARN